MTKTYKLIENNHNELITLAEGTVSDLTEWLIGNYDIFDWILEEDPEAQMPELNDDIEVLRELKYELEKVNHDWWSLEVGEI